MASFTCKSCEAPLPQRSARCRNCGWASDYDPRTTWRERELVMGVSLILMGIVFAIGIASLIAYVQLMQ